MSDFKSAPGRATFRKRRSRFTLRKVTTVLVLLILVFAIGGIMSQVSLWRASVAIENRDHRAARQWLTVGSWTWVRGGEWYFLSAIVDRRNGDFAALEESLQSAHQKNWNTADLERQQMLALAQTGQFQDIGNKWSELFLDAGSDGPEICKAFVNFSLARFQIAAASKTIEAWKRDYPDDPEAWFVEGRILIVLQRWPDAENALRQALEREPGHQQSLKELAIPLMKQLKFPDAEAVLKRALAGESESPEIIAPLAHCVMQQGRTDEAKSLLDDALQRTPSHLGVLAETGRLHLELGELDQAVKYLSQVVTLQPENTELRYALAQALRSFGKEDEAQQHFRLVDEGTRALLQLSRLTAQVVEDPSNVELRFKIASTTWKWKSRSDGEAWLRSVLEYDPTHKDTHKLLAEHYESIGRKDEAEYHRKMAQGG